MRRDVVCHMLRQIVRSVFIDLGCQPYEFFLTHNLRRLLSNGAMSNNQMLERAVVGWSNACTCRPEIEFERQDVAQSTVSRTLIHSGKLSLCKFTVVLSFVLAFTAGNDRRQRALHLIASD